MLHPSKFEPSSESRLVGRILCPTPHRLKFRDCQNFVGSNLIGLIWRTISTYASWNVSIFFFLSFHCYTFIPYVKHDRPTLSRIASTSWTVKLGGDRTVQCCFSIIFSLQFMYLRRSWVHFNISSLLTDWMMMWSQWRQQWSSQCFMKKQCNYTVSSLYHHIPDHNSLQAKVDF